MNKAEFHRLMAYHNAKKNRPTAPVYAGRRLVKGRAKGVLQILAKSRVIPQISLER